MLFVSAAKEAEDIGSYGDFVKANSLTIDTRRGKNKLKYVGSLHMRLGVL